MKQILNSMAEEEVVKVDFMLKRARLKGRFNVVNYKSRWFVLTKSILRYHDGQLQVSLILQCSEL